MRVYFLGTAGAGGPPGRAHNCFLVESRSARVVLDFGEASSWRLDSLGFTLRDIDLVYVSHEHLDHWGGLFDAAVLAMAAHGPSVGLRIATHESILGVIESLVKPSLPREVRSRSSFVGVSNELVVGDLRIVPVPSKHSVPTYGALVTDGEVTIYYTADTSPDPAVEETVREADLVIHEATLPEGMEDLAKAKGHTTVPQVVSLSKVMKPYSVIALVHITKESEEYIVRRRLKAHNKVRVLLPYDLTVIDL